MRLRSLTFAGSFIAMSALVNPAYALVVDFGSNNGSALNAGDVITDFDFGGGLTGDVTATGGTSQAVVFDTDAPTGGDLDLGSPFEDVDNPGVFRGFGNALIVQENAGDPIVPDDAVGGTLTFAFDEFVTLNSISLLDVEEGTTVTLFDDIGGILASQSGGVTNSGLPGNGPNQFIEFVFNTSGVQSFTVDFEGSGAVGEFEAAVVPLPASLVLFLSALAGLGFVSRFRRSGSVG